MSIKPKASPFRLFGLLFWRCTGHGVHGTGSSIERAYTDWLGRLVRQARAARLVP